MVAYLEANTVNFDQGFGKATQTVGRFSAVSAEAARGSAMVDKAFTNLAFASVGLEGKVGKLAEGLLMFGGGSGTVIAVAAGIGAIGFAMRELGSETEKTTKRIDELIKTSRSGAAGAAAADAPLRARLSEIESQLRETRPLGPGFRNPMTWMMRVPTIQGAARDSLMAEQARISNALNAGALDGLSPSLLSVLGMSMGTTAAVPVGFMMPRMLNTAGPLGLRGPSLGVLSARLQHQAAMMQTTTGTRSGGLFNFSGISGQDAALSGIAALSGAMSGGGMGALLGGGLSLAGSAFGPVGSALGGLLGQGISGLFGRGESEEVRQLKLLVAINTRQLEAMERQPRANNTVLFSSDARNPAAVDALNRTIDDLEDRGVRTTRL